MNRGADNPLEVQLLADLALPLIHDRVLAWDAIRPDAVQRMLLAGLAVDSPADAAVLHPGLFETASVAEHALRSTGFKRQIPIGTIYREIALKSARYRRGGRGRSWQRAVWLETLDADPRSMLERAVGAPVVWESG